MMGVHWIFHFRWILWGLGLIFLIGWGTPSGRKQIEKWEKPVEKNYVKVLFGIVFGFFALGVIEKYSQLSTLSLNSQDFWLHVDILEQMKSGGFFLTRFAPQGLGYVQHGAVHPSFSWIAFYPFLWILSPLLIALILNPLSLCAAGGMIGILSRKRWGSLASIFLTFAFLSSTQVGKILNYDVHPEAAYPFLMLLWFWSLGWDGTQKVRWISLILSCLFCVGVKEDAFLVIGPWIFWGCLTQKKAQKKAIIVSGILLILCAFIQTWMVKNWTQGIWGPQVWQGTPVMTTAGVQNFGGHHWSGVSDIWKIVQTLISEQNGVVGILRAVLSFLFSRPWWSLLILAPWVIFESRFWIVILPLAGAYSLLEGPRHLWNYYSAPFLATFWFCAISFQPSRWIIHSRLSKWISKVKYPNWILLSSLLLGSGGISFYFPSSQSKAIKDEVKALLPCLQKSGLVASHLIGLVPFDRIWTDRVPPSQEQWGYLDFALFSPKVGRFEMSQPDAQKLFQTLSQNQGWVRVGSDCRALTEGASQDSDVVLFVRTGFSSRR